MTFDKNLVIRTQNFKIRFLDPITDSFESYLSWLRDSSSNKYILAVDTEMQMPELIQYVSKKNSSTDAMLLGIFTNDNEQHIGNIKFEPFNSYLKEAWFGILIGNQNYRGKGFGFEIINECMNYMNSNFNLQIFKLGVDAANAPAINLYRRLGFHQEILPEFGREKIVMIKKI